MISADRYPKSNVYSYLAVALPFIHTRSTFFSHIISELLFYIYLDKIFFSSDYAI